MAIISIQRDQNNTISIVRMQVSDTLATVSMTDYILNNQIDINALNGGTWQWFITDMILVAAEDGNAFYEFVDTSFATMVIFGQKGTGTVNPGLQNNIPYYAANGNTLSPLSNLANAILATNGSSLPGLTQTLPTAVQANISTLGTVGNGVWNATPVTVPFGGSGASTFTAYSVLCAGTTATGSFQHVSGVGSSGQILTSNGAAALPTWQNPAGSGTVNSGLQNQLAYYAADGTTVSGLTSIASGILITSGLGVPSISQTLPSAVQGNITALGVIASGTWNGAIIGSTYGGSGVSNPTAHGIMVAEGSSAMTPIVLSSGQILIGSTGNDPVPAAINSGTGILVANGAGSITVNLASASNNTIKSNISGLSAAPIDNTLTAILDAIMGSTQGNILYRNGTIWTVLAPGTSGNFLQTQGTSANPQWAAGASVTPAALTKTDDTNVTLTLGGTPATALLQATSITAGWTGQLSFARGGTNANLTASNGGILYSTATAGAILAGTATASKMLLSGATAAPTWSTSTIPSSAGATANKVLLSDGTNYVLSTPTFPNASATTGKIIISDGTNWIASTPTYPSVAGTSGNVLTSDGTNWLSSTPTVVSSGTYTPTLTNTSNVSSSTAYSSQYMRVGSVVTVSGRVDITPTLTLTNTNLGMSLPIPSDFANLNEGCGTANCNSLLSSAAIFADATNNNVSVVFLSQATGAEAFFYTFTYRII